MTPEEKELIEAALMLRRFPHGNIVSEDARGLWQKIEALRESRKPKPKWRRDDHSLTAIIGPDSVSIEVLRLRSSADATITDMICDLLNKADPA